MSDNRTAPQVFIARKAKIDFIEITDPTPERLARLRELGFVECDEDPYYTSADYQRDYDKELTGETR